MIDGGKHIPDHFDQAAVFEPNAIPQARGSECDEPVWMEWTPGMARRSSVGNPACLLHPATLRAAGVQGSAARFRAWRIAPG